MSVILTGSIAYDYLMRFPGRFVEHIITEDLHQVSLSFLVDEMTRHWGGVAANISFTLAMLGAKPKLFGTVGRDFGEYRRWLESRGVDCSLVQQIDQVFTASFFANTDLDNNQIASFYAGAMAYASQYRLTDVHPDKPDWVVVSPNDPKAMSNLCAEARASGARLIYDPSQQVPRLSGEELSQDIDGAYAMVVNAYEASIISKKTGLSLEDLRAKLPVLVITKGKHGATIYHGDTHEGPHPRADVGLAAALVRVGRVAVRHLRARAGRHPKPRLHPQRVRRALPRHLRRRGLSGRTAAFRKRGLAQRPFVFYYQPHPSPYRFSHGVLRQPYDHSTIRR
ncbi:MAG: PfkB family carbohydrate kinase [Anaerolineae bacterium]|nr:PfkB family carbohydrate kinase [Anaerolineae bacterium]